MVTDNAAQGNVFATLVGRASLATSRLFHQTLAKGKIAETVSARRESASVTADGPEITATYK